MAVRPPPLSRAASRALPAVEAGVARGLSGNEIGRILTAEGAGVRRIALQEAIRFVQDKAIAADRLRFIRHDRLPDPERIPFARYPKNLRADFSFVVEMAGLDTATGASVTRWVTVTSDRLLTRDEIEDEAIAAAAEGDPEDYPFEPERVLLVGALRR